MIGKLQKMREDRAEGDSGFTLIELLVVVVIIGVLIAIAIPLYLNYRKGAENKSAASDVRGAISTLEQCYSDSSVYPTSIGTPTNNSYTTLTGCGTTGASITVSSGNVLAYWPVTATAPASYIITGTHGTNGPWYCYNSANGGSVKTETTTWSATTAVTAC